MHSRAVEAEYLGALKTEIGAHEWTFTPDTVYLGGGTPSAALPEAIADVLKTLPGIRWREATMEAAPGSFDLHAVDEWRTAGINRVSLGVQSFVKHEVARTGRRHDADAVERDVALLRGCGITNINADLIAGLPGQTAESWAESLARVIDLGVPHVSVYMLEVDEDSRLGLEILGEGSRYGARDVPSEDEIASFYEAAVERLAGAGIARYEISNFAIPGAESLHNLKYWRREPYIGFGADAHSFDGARRWRNPEPLQEYLRAPHRLEVTDADPNEERFFVGLRLSEGVTVSQADWARHGTAFARFLEAGLLERSGDRVRLTARGVMVSNEVFQEFLAA